MPAVAIVAIVVAAGAAAYSGYASSSASRNATRAQREAADRALAFEREREAARKAEYDAAMGKYRTRMSAWQRRRDALLERYGVEVTNPVSQNKDQPAPGSTTPTQGVGTTPAPAVPQQQMPQDDGTPSVPATFAPPGDPNAPPSFGDGGFYLPEPTQAQTAVDPTQGFGIPQQGATLGDMLRARQGYGANTGQGV